MRQVFVLCEAVCLCYVKQVFVLCKPGVEDVVKERGVRVRGEPSVSLDHILHYHAIYMPYTHTHTHTQI